MADHPLSLTPDGNKRNAYSFLPFFGGRRICFGKTFADINLKIVTLYLAEFFSFSFVNPADERNHPVTNMLTLKTAPLKIKVTKRQP